MASSLVGKQAVVVGAGIGGLAATGAIAQHFEQVVVVERDALPAEPVDRPGIPQGRHVHGLLVSGQRALDALFPGFEQDIVRAGAVPIISGLDIRWERPGYDPFPRRDLGLRAYALSRPALEYALRRRVEGLSNVELRQGCRVLELLATRDGAAVAGVRCENSDGSRETLEADLVIDASGRGALTLALLKSIGRPPPEETTIGVDFGYATSVFAVPDNAPTDWKGVMTFGGRDPLSSRGALLYPLEGNRWMLGLGGRHGEEPPGYIEGFLAFARGLRTPTIYNAIRHARPLGAVVRYGFPESVLRHFERLETFPRGLLPIADAICRFNPVLRPGHERRRAGGLPAQGIAGKAARGERSTRRAGARLFCRGAGADRDAVVGGDHGLHASQHAGTTPGRFRHEAQVRHGPDPARRGRPGCSQAGCRGPELVEAAQRLS